MKKRKLLGIVGLSIITLGIYDIFWLVKVKKELNAKTKVHVPSIWLLFLPLILLVVSLIILIVSAVSSGTSPVSNNTTYNFNNANSFGTSQTTTTTSNSSGSAIIFILLYFVSVILWFVLSFYWFLKFSKAIREYTDGKMNVGETFLLLWVLHFFGVLIIQDTFNDMIDEGTIPSESSNQPSAPMAPAPVHSPEPNQPAAPVMPPAPVSNEPTVISPMSNPSVAPQPAVVVSPSTDQAASQNIVVQ